MFSFRQHLEEAKKRAVSGLVIETLSTSELNERMHSGKLKFKDVPYWFGTPWRNPETYTWIVASTSKGEVVGFVEFELNPYDKTQVWLKNISTKAKYQNRGVASAMIPSMVEAAKKLKKTVVRSTPTEHGLAYTSDKITAALDTAGINWK